MMAEADSIYLSGEYVKNDSTRQSEDSGWKNEQIARALRDAGVDPKRGGPETRKASLGPVPLGGAPLPKKWRFFIVYSHSSEILTFPGEGLRGTALVEARFSWTV
jgi:hypothetical protein